MHSRTMWLPLAITLMLATPALAGTPNDPEIIDLANDSNISGESSIPGLEITKAWIQPKDDRFHFIIEVASLSVPQKDHVFVFHYSWQAFRLYFRANHSVETGGFEFIGGLYEGVKGANGFDPEGNRNYFYMPGNASQEERIQGEIIPGSPGRIVWSYPMDSYTVFRDGLQFKGLFVTTYLKRTDGSLQYIDLAVGQKDYLHKIWNPWYAKILPAPSLALVALAAIGTVVAISHKARRR